MPARLYVMVGIPGSGKSSYVRKHLGGALRVSLDDLRLMMTGIPYDPLSEPAVVAGGHALLEALLVRANAWRRDVVLDATNATRQMRRRYVKMARAHKVNPVAVYLPCELAIAQARDASRPNAVGAEVVQKFYSRLQPPATSEGFDQVITVLDES